MPKRGGNLRTDKPRLAPKLIFHLSFDPTQTLLSDTARTSTHVSLSLRSISCQGRNLELKFLVSFVLQATERGARICASSIADSSIDALWPFSSICQPSYAASPYLGGGLAPYGQLTRGDRFLRRRKTKIV